QIGRPDDGTDPTGFYNAEFLLALKDRSQWRPEFHGHKDDLIDAINHEVGVIPGVSLGFSQPISDNVEEALTGVKGQLAVKIVGDDLNALDDIADQIAQEIGKVQGVVDLGIFRELGQSNLHIEIQRDRAQRYGLTVADIEAVIEGGIGGKPVTQIVEGERRHDLVVRYAATDRDSVDAIKGLLVPVADGRVIPLGQVADVSIVGGATRIFREANRRYIAIKFGVRDRDLGSTVADAQARVAKAVRIPPGYDTSWGGEFESARRAGKRLAIVIPATMALIFVLLFAMFRRPREAGIILGNVLLTSPFGGLAALLLTHTNFSVSSGVGFLALFGVSVQTGVILVAYINELRAEGRTLDAAISEAADLRLRPIMMTALVATLGLLPAAMSNGIGSDSQKPLAIVVVGGLVSSLSLSLFMLPLLYRLFAPPIVVEKAEPIASVPPNAPPSAAATTGI
ncbi:MAG TPA: efflux RND transporter permease subunit, partial [Polyangiales bacterium]|nr:efflux RND transporter permease subunit [Polyangiales bacterium]